MTFRNYARLQREDVRPRGFGLTTPRPKTFDPAPPLSAAVEFFRRPSLPYGVEYALLLRPTARPSRKPLACASLRELAQAIHRRREGEGEMREGLSLSECELPVQERQRPVYGVSVWTTDPLSGERARCIGFAFLRGAGRELLTDALRQVEPEVRG